MNQWQINVAQWVIQDGNYPNFYCGQISEFALELSGEGLLPFRTQEQIAGLPANENPPLKGEIVYTNRLNRTTFCIIDFGIKAYLTVNPAKMENLGSGSPIEGEARLSVDPFFYYEGHNKLPGVFPLIYTWRIDQIIRETAPFIYKTDAKGVKVIESDYSRLVREKVERTDVWHDPHSSVYRLYCTKLDIEPKYDTQRSLDLAKRRAERKRRKLEE